MNILILATSKTSLAVRRIHHEALKRGHTVRIINPMDLFLRISSSESGYDNLYVVENGKVSRINIKDYDAVIPRIGENLSHAAFILEHINKNLRIFSTNSAEAIRVASNQLKTLQILSSCGIPTAKTVFAQNPNHIEFLIDKIGYPLIIKLLHGSGGYGVSLVRDKKTAIPVIQSLFKSKSSVLLQEYLPAGGKDYRVIVIGGEVVAAMERTAAKSDFRANLKQDGTGKPVMLDEADKQLCINAAKALGLGSVGIDLIKANGRTYTVEANQNHGWSVEQISGINIAKKLIMYCEMNYQSKNVEKSQVISFQKQILDERLTNEFLSKQVQGLNEKLNFFTKDKYINSVYKKARGMKIAYQDRGRNNRQIKVTNMRDIFQIMKDSFYIK